MNHTRRNAIVWIVALFCVLFPAATVAHADPGQPVFLPIIARPGAPAPSIVRFTASPVSITAGSSSTLTWEVSGATRVTITPGVGEVGGASVKVSPADDTEYTLTASNSSGSSSAKAVITVEKPPPAFVSGATWLPFETTPDGVAPTRGGDIAVDSQGGAHVVYALKSGLDGATRPAYYAYCSAECEKADRWSRARLDVGDWVADVRIQLDAQGRPRLLIFSKPPNDQEGLGHYTYGRCDAQCTSASQWALTQVAASRLQDVYRWDYVYHYFALDPQGHPAFIYTDASQGINHNGTFYATCASEPANCSDRANWNEVKLDPHWLSNASLTFTAQGEPRAAVFYYDETDTGAIMKLLYLECNQGCMNTENWQGLFLADLHGTSRFGLRLDGEGRPRMVLYSGAFPDPMFKANLLYYLWCNANCALAGQNDWNFHEVGLTAYNGQDADLVLGAQARPRIAYDAFGFGLGLAWCDSNCESTSAAWQHKTIEASTAMEQHYPVAPIRRCSISTWTTGSDPIVALDGKGNPRLVYVAEHGYGGTDLDEPWKQCPTFTDIVLVRYAQASLP